MLTLFKKSLIVVVLTSIALVTFADKGVGKKSKAKTNLNITTKGTLKNSIAANIKTGLAYKGSLLSTYKSKSGIVNNLVTYQKGNTTYIIPYKHKYVAPEIKQGYTGLKLVIRRNK
jgi:hypothetical protein